jgi:hypothetical protein
LSSPLLLELSAELELSSELEDSPLELDTAVSLLELSTEAEDIAPEL